MTIDGRQAHIDCDCGYSGAIRIQDTIGRCIGCDQLYKISEERVMPVSEMPQFDSFEEMQKFLDSATTGVTAGEKVKVPKKRAPKRKPVAKDTGTSLTKASVDTSMVQRSFHFYLRTGDSFDQVLKDGREEVKYSGSFALIFCHNHKFAEQCTSACRGMN
jgi:hypothetical protein